MGGWVGGWVGGEAFVVFSLQSGRHERERLATGPASINLLPQTSVLDPSLTYDRERESERDGTPALTRGGRIVPIQGAQQKNSSASDRFQGVPRKSLKCDGRARACRPTFPGHQQKHSLSSVSDLPF